VERREVDRLLRVHAEVQVAEEERERPLVLLVTTWRAEGQAPITCCYLFDDHAGAVTR